MTSLALPSRAGRRSIRTIPARGAPTWKAVQLLGIAATIALIAGLLFRPAASLHIVWDMVIPLLPAVFLVNPMLWRNACPVATLNAWAGERSSGRHRSGPGLRAAWAVGIVLLLMLVPARHVIFNDSGSALALLITALAVTALATGLVYDRRAGFCSAFCPVLPVEKLYGQSPLVQVGSARCPDCSLCVATGCPDLARGKAAAQAVRDPRHWMITPYGAFAAMFPGVIAGYFTFVAESVNPYLHLALAAGASWVVVSMVAEALRLEGRDCLPMLGAVAFAAYYWWAGPRLAEAYAVDLLGVPLRWAAIALAAVWLRRATVRPVFAPGAR